MMQKVLFLIMMTSSVLFSNVLFAQTPQSINYQAVIRDNSVNPATIVANQQVGLEFLILDQNSTTVYSETHTVSTNAFGLVNLKIGEGIPNGSFSNINWGLGTYTLQTSVDITGGTNYSNLGTSSLASVPYTFQAANSRGLSDPDQDSRIDISPNAQPDKINFVTSGMEAMTIDSLQQIGIGVSAPEYQVDVRGNASIIGVRAIDSKNSAFIDFRDSLGSVRGMIGVDGQGFSGNLNQFSIATWTNTPIAFLTNTQRRMVIDTLGRVGIGTATPSSTLEVNGSFKLTNGTQANGRVLTSDASGNASWQPVNLPPGSNIPSGVIVMWNGNTPPAGWVLCDGNNNTPDLRGRFILGMGQGVGLSPRSLGDAGGAEQVLVTVANMPAHTHGINDPGHHHTWTASRQNAGTDDNNNTSEFSKGDFGQASVVIKDTDTKTTGITVQSAGNGAPLDNIPPYYSLAYIMKL